MSAWLLLALLPLAAPLPIEFDTDPGYRARPTFLANAAAHPRVSVAEGVLTLGVAEAGRGMKFELPLRGLDSDRAVYLVMRYRARHLAGGYALWAYDDSQGGRELLNTGQLKQDGQWHLLALHLADAGARGVIRSLLTEIQCAGAPAELSLDYLRASDEVPAGADQFPPARVETPPRVLRFGQLPRPTPQPGWLSERAKDYTAEVADGVLHLRADGRHQGMKFTVALPEPLDLKPYTWAALRYRAVGLAPWGDYAVWLGSGPGGQPDQSTSIASLSQLEADGHWHVALVALKATFAARDLAVQVCAADGRGELWLDSLSLSNDRPLVAATDVLTLQTDWTAARLTAFQPVDLAPLADARAAARLRSMGLRSWLPGGKVTAQGIPFHLLAAERNVVTTPEDINRRLAVPIGTQATELYLLAAARLPSRDGARMGDPVAMTRFGNPERFRVAVVYGDGVTDELFPVCVTSGRYEVRSGPEVYALTSLRAAPIERIELINRMDTAWFALAGVTANQGPPATTAPAVLGLPPTPPAWPAAATAPAVRVGDGELVLDDGRLSLTLATRPGLKLTGATLRGGELSVVPGPLFTLGAGEAQVTSEQVTAGPPVREGGVVHVPFASTNPAVPIAGELLAGSGPDGLALRLAVRNTGSRPLAPKVRFPILAGARLGTVADTWYLWGRKGGIVANRPVRQRQAYGGEYPLQVADLFNPRQGYGLALFTRDLADVYRHHELTKDARGVDWSIDYWPAEVPAGGTIETVPTVLKAHAGDWRAALGLYRRWAQSWYRPQSPPKDWFQRVFYYQQTTAWGQLRDAATGRWRMKEVIEDYRNYHGCLDYLHIFDFGDSPKYGRVGDYNHYDELGGLAVMRAAIAQAQAMGVRIGLYIEGYLCDERGVWGKPHVARYDIRQPDGKPLLWNGAPMEHMMCPAAQGWRDHQAETYRRVTGELQPDGMYIDQYGFLDTWKTCWSREHGHPVPMGPLRGERATTAAIRAAMPATIANLTEETPNDVNSQHQDGALGYSVTFSDPTLMPHRVDLFRFCFPSFKVFQLTSYNAFTEGGWQLLKWPFFNGEGYWLGGGTSDTYCEDAHQFLRDVWRITHQHTAAFCSTDVEPLVPTLVPTVYANRFTGGGETVWTLFNADYRTVRGGLLRVPHRAGTIYTDAFSGRPLPPTLRDGQAEIALELGPWGVGCVVARPGP